eukprot:1399027-Prymnesium_polylepis.1
MSWRCADARGANLREAHAGQGLARPLANPVRRGGQQERQLSAECSSFGRGQRIQDLSVRWKKGC